MPSISQLSAVTTRWRHIFYSPRSVSVENVLQDVRVRVWVELVAVTLVEFVVEFYPVQTNCVQEALQHVHAHQHTECHGPQHWPENDSL